MFICPKCEKQLQGFHPNKCVCGYEIQQIDYIYEFCNDPPISLETDGYKYLGYEYVGENYNGPPSFSREKKLEHYSIFGDCSKKLVEILGNNCVVLDLGAGLGSASIPLAMAGAKTIAADISRKMLSFAVDEAFGKKLDENLIFTRMNGYNLLLSDNSVDAVIANDMLQQVDNPDAVVKEIIRVLKPDGVFVKYGCSQLPLTEQQNEIKIKCGSALNDIQNYYKNALFECGYSGYPFSSWDKENDCIDIYFEKPEFILSESDIVWTGSMEKSIHKLMTRASGYAQLISDEIHIKAWQMTDDYAKSKYGIDYQKMPGYNRFTGLLQIYKIKNSITKH
ncbi:MAG: class I SAM-dependent methyltransferase [Eubacteriales bacterium]